MLTRELLRVIAVPACHYLGILYSPVISVTDELSGTADPHPMAYVSRVVDECGSSRITAQVQHPAPVDPAVDQKTVIFDQVIDNDEVRSAIAAKRRQHGTVRAPQEGPHVFDGHWDIIHLIGS
jgi:hypothetical protein